MFQNTLSQYSTLNTNLVGAENNLNSNWVSGFAYAVIISIKQFSIKNNP